MTLAAINANLVWPPAFLGSGRIVFNSTVGGLAMAAVGTVDAATEKLAFVGQVFWEGRPGSAKTMGATSKIHFRTGTVTFADAATNLRIGLQDVITASGTLQTPDGTFDVYADVAGNSGTITSADDNVTKSVTLSTSGTKDVAHGDRVAVVFDMTARGGTDSFILLALGGPGSTVSPASLSYAGSWFLGSVNQTPNVMLEASDGTLGILRGGTFVANTGPYSFQASSTPDERGLIFQVPYRCSVDAVMASLATNSALADYSVVLYSTPLGTPSAMATVTMLGEHGPGGGSERPIYVQLASEVTLEPNTDYCVAIQATGTAVVDLGYVSLSGANVRSINGLANSRLGTRSNGSGAFAETTTEIPLLAVVISALDDGAGSGGGMLRHPGMSGGLNG